MIHAQAAFTAHGLCLPEDVQWLLDPLRWARWEASQGLGLLVDSCSGASERGGDGASTEALEAGVEGWLLHGAARFGLCRLLDEAEMSLELETLDAWLQVPYCCLSHCASLVRHCPL